MKINICYWNRNRNVLRITYTCISAKNNPLISQNKFSIKIIIILKKRCTNPQYHIIHMTSSDHFLIKLKIRIQFYVKQRILYSCVWISAFYSDVVHLQIVPDSITQQILSHSFYDWKLCELFLLSGILICHSVGWYIELKNQKFWWRIPERKILI
jgi:hypothetical protein